MMRFLIDNKLTNPVSDSVDTDFPASNLITRHLGRKFKSAAVSKADVVTLSFTADDWEGFGDDLTEEAEAELVGRYKLEEESGATAVDELLTTDLTLTAGAWESLGETNSRWLMGGTSTTTAASHIQSVLTRTDDLWWTPNIASLYTFETEDGTDSSINGHDLTASGASVYGDGPWGLKAVTLNGTTDYFSTAAWFAPGTDSFTIEVVFKTTSTSLQFFVSQGASYLSVGFYVYIQAGAISAAISDGTNSFIGRITNSLTYADGNYHQTVVTFNRDSGLIYCSVDGIDDTRTDVPPTIPTALTSVTAASNIVLGRSSYSAANYFTGSIALVNIISAALSADDAATRYNALTGTLTEETKVYGPLDENQSAAFHGGLINDLSTKQDLTTWATGGATNATVYNDNYNGYSLYSITNDILEPIGAKVIGDHVNCFCVFKAADSLAAASTARIRIMLGAVSYGGIAYQWDGSAWVFASGTGDTDYEIYNSGDLLIVGSYFLVSVNGTYEMNIDATLPGAGTILAGLPLAYEGQTVSPFNLNATAGTAHNETGIAFYPRDGMVKEIICKCNDYSSTANYQKSWYKDATNYLNILLVPTTGVFTVALQIEGGGEKTLSVTIPAAYINTLLLVSITVSVASPSLSVKYGYLASTGDYTAELTDTTWSATAPSFETVLGSTTLVIGDSGAGSLEWNGFILSDTISHPDDPTYYFKREWNLPWGDYVEKPNAFSGANIRHVYLWNEFKPAALLDKLASYPEGVDNASTELAIWNSNLSGRDTVVLKTSTGITPITQQTLNIEGDDYYNSGDYWTQLDSTIPRFTTAELVITIGRDKTLEIGWMILGTPLSFPDPNFGSVPAPIDNDIISRSWSGDAYVDRGVAPVKQLLSFTRVLRAEWDAFIAHWFSALRKEPGLFILTEDTTIYTPYFAMMDVYTPIDRVRGYLYPFSIEFTEVL